MTVTTRDEAATLAMRVVLGPCDDMRAEVFVRAALPGEGSSSIRLEGSLAGPECGRSITLPATATLVDLGAGEAGPLAKAVLTEPAFWTPDLPNLYRLVVRATIDGRSVAEASRRIGLRRSGVRGRSLWMEGRRWVPRGVACAADACEPQSLREAGAAALVGDPPDALLEAADAAGLALIAVVEPEAGNRFDVDSMVDRLAVWSAHPSVVVAVLPAAFDDPQAAAAAAQVRRLKGTMLIGRCVDGASPPPTGIAAGIDLLVVVLDAGTLPHAGWREAAPAVPLIAWRRSGMPPEARRAGCDALQAALAGWGLADGRPRSAWDWAGYLVS